MGREREINVFQIVTGVTAVFERRRRPRYVYLMGQQLRFIPTSFVIIFQTSKPPSRDNMLLHLYIPNLLQVGVSACWLWCSTVRLAISNMLGYSSSHVCLSNSGACARHARHL